MLSQKILNLYDKLLYKSLRAIFYLWKRRNLDLFKPRFWSNAELRRISSFFSGDIINVSAGSDKDKEGRKYRDYFENADSYTITNFFPETHDKDEIIFDLREPIDRTILSNRKYDVVMAHTVLEHIFELDIAIDNLCNLSKDIVITIVPFIQAFHHDEGHFCDYWRFTPFSLKQLFDLRGFATVYVNWNNDPLGNIYLFHVSSKDPEKWRYRFVTKWPDKIKGPGYNRQMLFVNSDICRNVLISKEKHRDLFYEP